MGLFDFFVETALAPVKLTAAVAKTAVRATAKAVQLDPDGVTEAMEKGVKEGEKAFDDITKAADE